MNQAQERIVRGNNSRCEGGRRGIGALFLLAALVLAAGGTTSRAQTTDQHKRKVPVLDKLAPSGGSGQLAFTGAVKALDLKGSVLEVTGARDGTDEYFPFKKSVHVSTADGKYATLGDVKQGWNVLLYYEEKDNGPSIKEIILLGPPKPPAPAPAPAKSAAPRPS